ncbi:MAG: DNA-processing protein DprA [Clostridia bacterium]|nr:DNA-processing protein DprA [Clostridia bacterium]
MRYTEEDRLNIFMSIAFEGAARSGLLCEANNGGAEEFRNRVLEGSAEFGSGTSAAKKRFVRECASNTYIDDFIAMLEKNEIVAVTRSDPLYPPLLANIYDPPYVLYMRGAGAYKRIEKPVAVIGTRHCSEYGRKVAEMMGEALAENGCTVISGLAYGCDSFAHEGAMHTQSNDYPTAAVLGQGVMTEKHDSTSKTMERILERGAVISEYLPRTAATRHSFPMRNRIISGISNAVLVVEAGRKSGTMITVDCALEQSRNVFAVPGRITDVLNCGTNEMLRKGMAQPVYSTDDFLCQLGIEPKTVHKEEKISITDPEQKRIYDLLAEGDKSFDTLLEKTGLTLGELSMHLTDLEFSGLIKQLPGRVYMIDR